MTEHLQPIYAVWDGNAEAMAADIDELGVTVRQWRNRGDIPSRAWPKIIRAAAARGTIVRLEDFLPPEVKSELPGHGGEDSALDRSASATKAGAIIGDAGAPDAPANNPSENIREGQEADSRGPFSGGSPSISSTTREPSNMPLVSPTSSNASEAEAA